jgi:hypothetical protein
VAFAELQRVLKYGGEFCIMLYHRYSLVCVQAYIVYGLLRARPFVSINTIARHHLESYGTRVFTESEARRLFAGQKLKVTHIMTPYDLRITRSRSLPMLVGKFLPRFFGYFMVLEGAKS